jgi:phenylacetate-coenzyme A ligase PaaK-like adenylate-forming protein
MIGSGRRALPVALRLWRHPRATREAVVAFQERMLREVVGHAHENVGYYRRLLGERGWRPDELRSVGDLAALPITTKSELRGSPPEERLDRRLKSRPSVRHLTSGSTAEPLEVWRSTAEETLLALFRLRAARQFGVRARDRSATLIEGRLEKDRRLAGRLAGAVGLYRREIVDCRQPAGRIADQLEQMAPDVVGGYPSALAFVAPEGGARVRPRVLLVGGETLSLATRRRIEEGFGAQVFDAYGVTECNLVAWECPEHGYLHVCDDNVVLEVLRDGAPVGEGETGEVVLTALHSYTMPFIRYALGDLAVRGPEPCPCGQPFSTIKSVEGRVADYFHLSGGRSIHPFAITDPLLLEDWTWVGRHQMEQEDRDRVVLRIAPLRPPHAFELDRVQSLGRETVGPDAHFRVELVESIPVGPGGKFRSYLPYRAAAGL